MTVIVACRAADDTLVFGADQCFTFEEEAQYREKLSFRPVNRGTALIGMAAEDVRQGLSHLTDLWIALNQLTFDQDSQDPFVVIEKRMKEPVSPAPNNGISEEVEILCGIASPALQRPKLLGIFDRETRDLDKNRYCCIGSGAGAATAFLKIAATSLQSLRDVQIAVCTSVWLAKQVDPRCKGNTDIWRLNADSSSGKLERERIDALEDYIQKSLPITAARWIAEAPF